MPWVGGLVHGVKVEGGLKLGLATGEEHDSGDCGGHAAVEHLQCVVCHLHSRMPYTTPHLPVQIICAESYQQVRSLNAILVTGRPLSWQRDASRP